MQFLDPIETTSRVMPQITGKGAFLTVESGSERNTMTIGWALLGFVWKVPVMTVLVRDSRHTFSLIEKSEDFSVSVPLADMSKELAFCGSKSGHDYDKFQECSLQCADSLGIQSPVVRLPGIHFECRIAYKSAMTPSLLAEEYAGLYPKKDFHTMYYGKVVKCYSTENEW